MSERIRWNVSLRQRDTELIEHFEKLANGDRSAECRRLMYLGLELESMRSGVLMDTEPSDNAALSIPQRRNSRLFTAPSDNPDKLNKRLDSLI
jgi:hypothetical protein